MHELGPFDIDDFLRLSLAIVVSMVLQSIHGLSDTADQQDGFRPTENAAVRADQCLLMSSFVAVQAARLQMRAADLGASCKDWYLESRALIGRSDESDRLQAVFMSSA